MTQRDVLGVCEQDVPAKQSRNGRSVGVVVRLEHCARPNEHHDGEGAEAKERHDDLGPTKQGWRALRIIGWRVCVDREFLGHVSKDREPL